MLNPDCDRAYRSNMYRIVPGLFFSQARFYFRRKYCISPGIYGRRSGKRESVPDNGGHALAGFCTGHPGRLSGVLVYGTDTREDAKDCIATTAVSTTMEKTHNTNADNKDLNNDTL